MSLITIIVPCFNEEKVISLLYNELLKIIDNELNEYNFEIILIDDGSNDNTLTCFKNLSKNDDRVKYISFSRNFGKESAIYAGLKSSSGDFTVLMDADLQDPPSLLPKMIHYIEEENYDCVATRRVSRNGEPLFRSFFANLFYRVINRLSDIKIVNGARDYRMMTRVMVDSILELGEYNRFSKGIFAWVGFETKWLKYENIERISGNSTWSFFTLLKYSLEGIVSFSTVLLHISTIAGILFSVLSFVFILIIIFRTIMFSDPVAGWTSTICVILFIGGIQLFCIGLLGQYLSKTYIETKKRPIYITKETNLY
jgi:glucosyltransferase